MIKGNKVTFLLFIFPPSLNLILKILQNLFGFHFCFFSRVVVVDVADVDVVDVSVVDAVDVVVET